MNHTIPFTWRLETIPREITLSNLYMPLIYSGIDDALMEFPEGYAEAFKRKIDEVIGIFGENALPFVNFDGFEHKEHPCCFNI